MIRERFEYLMDALGGGDQIPWSSRGLRGREGSVVVSHQHGGLLLRLPVGLRHYYAARKRTDDRSGDPGFVSIWECRALIVQIHSGQRGAEGDMGGVTFVVFRRPPMPTSRMRTLGAW